MHCSSETHELLNELQDHQTRGTRPENCEDTYKKIITDAYTARTNGDRETFAELMVIANGYSKLYSREDAAKISFGAIAEYERNSKH